MNIAVLFDGVGLARLGLEQAGHTCTGFELNPKKHELSKFVGSGNCHLADARDVNLTRYDAVWASPPCQTLSRAKIHKRRESKFGENLLPFALKIPNEVLWVENVYNPGGDNTWGVHWNAAQFELVPRQNRNRIIGGRHRPPKVFHPYQKIFKGVCPTITATEYKGSTKDLCRASRFYGRMLSVQECAYHQGFDIPYQWSLLNIAETEMFEGIGNGVPVYMAKAFGLAYEP